MAATAYRASIFHCLRDPGPAGDTGATEFLDDGLLLVDENGRVETLAASESLLPSLSESHRIVDLRGRLIVPGFVDCHVHFPQVDIIASYGEQLLDWLNHYAYPAEMRFADTAHAKEVANYFVRELLRNGTTTAMVFATSHPGSVDAVFEAAKARNMRLLSGKVLMDRNCPRELADTPQRGYDESRTLIGKWHGEGRLSYAITPRFALTSSDQQLQLAGKLADEFPDVYVHTHLAENHDEIAAIAKLFPQRRSYLDVYDHHHLLRERSVFAHSLHLDADDLARMAAKGAAMAFCPGSNLFLGSGLFDLAKANAAGIRVGVGSDVGGGTHLNILRTLGDAYKVLQLQRQSLPAVSAFYLATLGGAKALRLENRIGNFAVGKEGDFVVLDADAVPANARRAQTARGFTEQLFALMMLGDDRSVSATYLMGKKTEG